MCLICISHGKDRIYLQQKGTLDGLVQMRYQYVKLVCQESGLSFISLGASVEFLSVSDGCE